MFTNMWRFQKTSARKNSVRMTPRRMLGVSIASLVAGRALYVNKEALMEGNMQLSDLLSLDKFKLQCFEMSKAILDHLDHDSVEKVVSIANQYPDLYHFPPLCNNTEYTTSSTFSSHIPVDTSTGRRAVSLLGTGLRCMLNMWWQPQARAYSYGIYVDTKTYMEHFLDGSHSDVDTTFASAKGKAVVLRLVQNSSGHHLAHGFMRTFGNRLPDTRKKTNMLGSNVGVSGDCGLGLEVRDEQVYNRNGAPPVAVVEKKNFFSSLFDRKSPQPKVVQEDPLGIMESVNQDVLTGFINKIDFTAGDEIVFAWTDDNNVLNVTLNAPHIASVPMCGDTTVNLQTNMLQTKYSEMHNKPVSGPEVAMFQSLLRDLHVPFQQHAVSIKPDHAAASVSIKAIFDQAVNGQFKDAATATPVQQGNVDWITANMNKDTRAAFNNTYKLHTKASNVDPTSHNAHREPVTLAFHSPALSIAVMKTYMGNNTVNSYANAEISAFWSQKTKQ